MLTLPDEHVAAVASLSVRMANEVVHLPCFRHDRRGPVQVQKLTDGFIKDVDSMCEGKEAELSRV